MAKVIEQIVRIVTDGEETKAEVVGEIVRCKDCIHCDCSIDGMGFFYCDFDEGRTVSPNGFCDVAERRNGDRG